MKIILAAYFRFLRGTYFSILSALHDLPSACWATCPSLERQIQALAVVQYILSFLIMGPVCSTLLIYLLCTDYWWMSVLYSTWLFFDWNTHKQAGRRSSWMRSWHVWAYLRDYFPIGLIKTHNLSPDRNYIFGFHPHGIFCFGGLCNFGTEANNFSEKFPGITPFLATLAGNFRMPLAREYLMCVGICPVMRDTIDFLLSRNGTGNAVIIAVGGAAESLNCAPGANCITLKGRKGFVRLALQHGADLVPVFSFGENEVYKQLILAEASWWRRLQKRLQKLLGFAPCVFQGCGFFSPESWGLLPYAKPITSVVGEPITMPTIKEPSPEVVDQYHAMYITSLTKLFDTHKTRFGLKQKDTLVIQ